MHQLGVFKCVSYMLRGLGVVGLVKKKEEEEEEDCKGSYTKWLPPKQESYF